MCETVHKHGNGLAYDEFELVAGKRRTQFDRMAARAFVAFTTKVPCFAIKATDVRRVAPKFARNPLGSDGR